MASDSVILTVNGGSSTIKFAAFDDAPAPKRRFGGQVDGAGENLLPQIQTRLAGAPISAIGHRIVHGGPRLLEHQRITPDVIAELRRTQPLDLAHLPREIAMIESFAKAFPSIPQVACFDTAFFRDLPTVAKLLPIPRRYTNQGLHKFGFHGLSYTYLMSRLAELAPVQAIARVILAHLGAGASMAAVTNGKPIDTTMSVTPTAGLVMATRPGDLDPSLVVYLMRTDNISPDAMDQLLSTRFGLIGVSETTSDMRDLLSRRSTDSRAADAVDLFCYQVRKHLGALYAALGGLDVLVFSGGIGEHSPEIRAAICDPLACLGITLDSARNTAHQPIISTDSSTVAVHIIPTDEESVIARYVRQIAFA